MERVRSAGDECTAEGPYDSETEARFSIWQKLVKAGRFRLLDRRGKE